MLKNWHTQTRFVYSFFLHSYYAIISNERYTHTYKHTQLSSMSVNGECGTFGVSLVSLVRCKKILLHHWSPYAIQLETPNERIFVFFCRNWSYMLIISTVFPKTTLNPVLFHFGSSIAQKKIFTLLQRVCWINCRLVYTQWMSCILTHTYMYEKAKFMVWHFHQSSSHISYIIIVFFFLWTIWRYTLYTVKSFIVVFWIQ